MRNDWIYRGLSLLFSSFFYTIRSSSLFNMLGNANITDMIVRYSLWHLFGSYHLVFRRVWITVDKIYSSRIKEWAIFCIIFQHSLWITFLICYRIIEVEFYLIIDRLLKGMLNSLMRLNRLRPCPIFLFSLWQRICFVLISFLIILHFFRNSFEFLLFVIINH